MNSFVKSKKQSDFSSNTYTLEWSQEVECFKEVDSVKLPGWWGKASQHPPLEVYTASNVTLKLIEDQRTKILKYCFFDDGLIDKGCHYRFDSISRLNLIELKLAINNNHPNKKVDKAVFLGYGFDQYGHFLTESLSRIWSVIQDDMYSGYKLAIVPFYKKYKLDKKFIYNFFELLGIQDRVVVIDGDTVFDELIIPNQSMHLYTSISPQQVLTWKKIKGNALQPRKVNSSSMGDKIYVSRKNSISRRRCNEEDIERVFSDFGFKVIYPENYSLVEQINIFHNAKYAAGCVGSAMHNTVFMQDHATKMVLYPESFINRMDFLISSAMKFKFHCYVAGDSGAENGWQDEWYIDTDRLRECLSNTNV